MIRLLALVLSVLLLASCEKSLKDTEFCIKYKTIDGSWEDDLCWDLPRDSEFYIDSENGAYMLMFKNSDTPRGLLKKGVIDYRIVSRRLVLDTTAKKVELIEPTLAP